MSNEIRITAGLQMTNGNDSLSINVAEQADQTNQGHLDTVIECVGGSGSKVAVDLSGMATGARVAFVRNLGASGQIYVAKTGAAELIELGPGEPATFRIADGVNSLDVWDDNTVSAGVKVRVIVLEP